MFAPSGVKQRVLTGSLLPEAAARLFWSIKIQEWKDRVTEGHWFDFIKTEIKLRLKREQHGDVRETNSDILYLPLTQIQHCYLLTSSRITPAV